MNTSAISPSEDDDNKKEDTPAGGFPTDQDPPATIEPIRHARMLASAKGYLLGQALRGLVSGVASGATRSLFDDFLGG